jgi:serine/threonine protein kinase/Tol biopolymer transport system component
MTHIDRLNRALEGHYRVDRELGAGGMATIYLAEDLRHHRQVAIKVLREDLGASVGAARFLREIEIAAHLQHPHILPLLDSGEADGLLYYIMPFVEGKSLRTRLAREHELPVPEAVRIFTEVVDGLSAAHEHGIVHRDIKPENVMLTGRHALVTDFGVARAISEATAEDGGSITTVGVTLGTPTYMSPEQASAEPNVDHRSDIYSVGVVAYEMLAGHPPFSGRTPQQVLAAQVSEQPVPLSEKRPNLDPLLVAAVMRCLEKHPADRWQRADELLAAIESLGTSRARLQPTPPASRRRSRAPLIWMAMGAIAGIAAVALLASRLADVPRPSLDVGRSVQLTSDPGLQIFPAISPDGKLVAYASGNARQMRIYIRPVDGGRTIAVSDDVSAVETQPRWSPDGSQLLFLSRGGVSVAPALGGVTRTVVPRSAPPGVKSAAWSPDGQQIAFVRGDSLFVQPVTGGASRFIAAGRELTACRWSPNDKWFACVQGNDGAVMLGPVFGNIAPSTIVVAPSAGGALRPVTDSLALHQSPEWSPDGTLLYFISSRDGPRDIYELSISRDGTPKGGERRVTTGLNAQSFSLGRDSKRLAYAVYSSRANVWTLPLSSAVPASLDAATAITSGTQTIESMRVSRDGRWLLYDSDLRGPANIYRIPIGGGQAEQLTHESFDVFAPDLSPDRRLLAYHSWRTGTRDIEVKPLDGGAVEIVTATPKQESYPSWSPDGSRLAYYDQVAPEHAVFVVVREGPGKWGRPLKVGRGIRPEWSHDGRLLAYVSADTTSLVVTPAEGGAERVVYAASDGPPRPTRVCWSADDRSLIFKSHDEMGRASFWKVPVEGGKPRPLAQFSDLSRPSNRSDFEVDTRRLYFTIEDKQSNVWVADITAR